MWDTNGNGSSYRPHPVRCYNIYLLACQKSIRSVAKRGSIALTRRKICAPQKNLNQDNAEPLTILQLNTMFKDTEDDKNKIKEYFQQRKICN